MRRLSRSCGRQVLAGALSAALLFLIAACSSGPVDGDAAGGDGKTARAVAPPIDPDERDRKAIEARIAAGIEALRKNDLDRARRHINRALEIDSSSPEAHNAMALYYRAEGDDRREEEHYRKAIRAKSDFSQARNNYASLLYRLGRYDDAIDQLEEAIEDPNYEQRYLLFLNLGRCYARTGELDKASSVLQRSMRLDSNQIDAPLELAEVLLTLGNLRESAWYYDLYSGRARQTARSLWIGVRLAHAMGDGEKQSNREFQLEQMFRNSSEYAAWLTWKNAGSPRSAGGR